MIKGLAITPPIIGRISIGKMVEKNGKRLPEKDDSFTITTQVQNKDGWLLHPLHAKLQAEAANEKIRAIPIKLLFNCSDLNLRAEYSLFDKKTGRPMCVGNGETARYAGGDGIQETTCPSPDGCELGKNNGCKPYGRLNVAIEGQAEELASFVFRTTGFNSIRTLTARLQYFEAVSNGNTRYLPLQLKLRAKSTTQSHRAPVYYVDLCLRDGVTLDEAVSMALAEAEKVNQSGASIKALEQAVRTGLSNGAFEESEDEIPAIVEEFYSEAEDSQADTGEMNGAQDSLQVVVPMSTKLTSKLCTNSQVQGDGQMVAQH
ncbi:hypothetical protein GALL_276580 [mine drainage metagenome]|uniref:Hydrolase or metal-binding protein n=1 Tax=mine drainage metagenome TaxID=410659 RepID=A0A1J5R372_9ZZZZ